MRSLFVASSYISTLSLIDTNSVAAHILILLVIEIEYVALNLLLTVCCSGCNASRILHDIHSSIYSVNLINFLVISVPEESIIICIQFKLF